MSDSNVALQFESIEQQRSASRLGLWIFLVTEIMFFGGAFLGYAVYRRLYPDSFSSGSRHLNLVLGTINTAVLLTSSFTMAMAVRGRGRRWFLGATILLGAIFLAIKAVEYAHKFATPPVLGSSDEQIFFSFYFAMTAIHAAHMAIGIGVLGAVWVRPRDTIVENAGLYWHFVDLVWIFLFPLFYLVA